MKEQKKQYERDRFENQFFELLKIHQINTEAVANSELKTHESVDKRNKSAKSGFEYLAETIKAEYVNDGDKKVPYVKGRERISDPWDKSISLDPCSEALHSIIANYLVGYDGLGLYFRHLLSLVKFVVRQDDKLLSYEDKRDYLEMVRSTMSESVCPIWQRYNFESKSQLRVCWQVAGCLYCPPSPIFEIFSFAKHSHHNLRTKCGQKSNLYTK